MCPGSAALSDGGSQSRYDPEVSTGGDHPSPTVVAAWFVLGITLGLLHGVEDEWEGGWGRTAEELEALVRAKCLEQVRA